MSPNLLIISFYFPPYNKVGGRRWAKHCKYFEKDKIKFKVLAGDFKDKSPWDDDIKPFENKISRVDLKIKKLPYHKRTLPNNIFQKIYWKLSLVAWRSKKEKLSFNYNDISIGNERAFFNSAKSIIESEQINTVIISVGPFGYSGIIPELKKMFPHTKFIIDYRDYWEDNFVGLNEEQINTEKTLQEYVINNVDLILSPNNEMKEYYKKKFNKPSYLLPHCIDMEDVLPPKNNNDKNSFKLIYGGAFYEDIDESISLIKAFIDILSKNADVKADFYVSVKGYEKELEHTLISKYDFLNAKDYFKQLSEADFVILILPSNRVNAMSSKFFELVAFKKPILYFGNKGEVSEFLVKNNLGLHITKENINDQALVSIANKSYPTIPNLNYNIEGHTFKYQTKELIAQIQKLCQQ